MMPCVICGAEITGKYVGVRKTCSDQCSIEANKRRNLARNTALKKEISDRNKQRYKAKREAFLLANKDEIEKRKAERARANKENAKVCTKRWKNNNIDRVRLLMKEKERRKRKVLSDGYIVDLIIQKTSLKRNQIPRGLIEAKREQLKILKLVKEMGYEKR